MYKYLIVGVTFLVVGGAGYYFNTTGGSDLIVQAISEGDGENYGVSGVEVFSGTYTCMMGEGCLVATNFILNGDTTLEITQENEEDGNQYPIKTGSWGVGQGGALIFLIDAVTTGTTSPGFSFVAKKVSGLTISGFSNKVKLLGKVENPTLTRISNE